VAKPLLDPSFCVLNPILPLCSLARKGLALATPLPLDLTLSVARPSECLFSLVLVLVDLA